MSFTLPISPNFIKPGKDLISVSKNHFRYVTIRYIRSTKRVLIKRRPQIHKCHFLQNVGIVMTNTMWSVYVLDSYAGRCPLHQPWLLDHHSLILLNSSSSLSLFLGKYALIHTWSCTVSSIPTDSKQMNVPFSLFVFSLYFHIFNLYSYKKYFRRHFLKSAIDNLVLPPLDIFLFFFNRIKVIPKTVIWLD